MERRAQAAESQLATATGQDALDHAIQAAELYMRAASDASSKADAARFRRRCQELIAFAERIKAQIAEALSTEAGIIQSTSRLHGNVFPIWEGDPSETEFQRPDGGDDFTDETVFTLSSAQADTFASWSRPREIFEQQSGESFDTALMESPSRSSLVQDITTDCSVVASLSAAMDILTGPQSILSSIFFPFDKSRNRPKLSESGKYVLRLHFNGCARRVVIDDRLPVSHTDRTLYVVDRQNPQLIWPALLEKAYLKVRGGYDFPGSNSGTDLWVLSGWIPEQLFLQREDLDLDETWHRIKTAHASHDLVITLGTGRISAAEEESMGLIGEHDYAVQALSETNGLRSLLVRNPWSAGPEWKGAGWTASPRLGSPEPSSDGALWLTLDDVAQNFESMYLNWNPKIFPHRTDRHFHWKLPPATLLSSALKNPQFSLESSHGGEIWVLISRHFVDAELEIARNSSGPMAAVSRQLGFMSILLFDAGGTRVPLADGETYRGPYVDSPQTLARLSTSPGKKYTLVLDQHEFPLPSYTFTLSAFSHQPVRISPAAEPMPQTQTTTGSWTRRTAGGNATCTTYFLNPQYRLSIPRNTRLSIVLSTDAQVPVHVDLVWAGGHRAMSVKVKDLLASSGDYRRSCAVLPSTAIDAGTYTVVVSTFDAGQTASFALTLLSAVPVSMDPVPPPAAGRMRTPLRPFTPSRGEETRRAALRLTRLTRASISLGRQTSPSLVRISVLRDWGISRVTVVESGEGVFVDPSSTALRTGEFDAEPGGQLWVVIESIGEGGQMEGDVFSEWPLEVGEWEVM